MTDEFCTSDEARQLDFWLGVWDLTWPAEQTGGPAGETQSGTNRIERLFGNCVIEENFSIDDGQYLGRSLSVFDEAAGLWRQTWVDSSGGYIALSGGAAGETFELHTEPSEQNGKRVVNRMIFFDITPNSLQWSWQTRQDDGSTWRDLWNIAYRRRT